MHKFIFLYDELMSKEMQEKLKINIKFISCGLMTGKMYWFSDKKIKRIYAIEQKNTTKSIYGGIFLMKYYEAEKHKLHAYYNSSEPFIGNNLPTDFYNFTDVEVKPIKIKSITDIQTCKYKIGEKIICGCFTGNENNKRILFNSKRDRYYGVKRIDKKNFIKMIEENTKEKKHGLE